MDQTAALLRTITPQNAAAPILVRATRVWETISKDTQQPLHKNIVFLDQEGNQIVAVVGNTKTTDNFPILTEGRVYQISNAKVLPAPDTFRAVDRDISLQLSHGTRVEPADDTGLIPKHGFKLTSLEDVADLVNATNRLIDVLGLVTGIGNLDKAPHGEQILDIVLANQRYKQITVRLWEERAHEFLAALQDTENNPTFAVVTGLLTKDFAAGRPTLYSTDATKCYLNIPYKPLSDLKDAMVLPPRKSKTDIPPPENYRVAQAEGAASKRLAILEILQYKLPDGERSARCLCLAEIVAVLEGEAWCNSCCPECGRKAQLIGRDYYCYICAQDVCELGTRLLVRVRDPTATTTFAIFSKELERLTSVPVGEILGGYNQGNTSAEIQPVLSKVVGKTSLFHIKICPYNTNLGYEDYAVVELSECVPPAIDPITDNRAKVAAGKALR